VSLRIRWGELVHFSTKALSYRLSLMMTFKKPMARAPSVPGRSCSHLSARDAKKLSRGSMQITLLPFFIRSVSQWPKMLSGHEAFML
jgi:hypothetical protein